MVDVAQIKLWGDLVGAVSWSYTRKLAYFQYDTNFIKQGFEISPIKMPLSHGNKIHHFPELRPEKNSDFDTFKGLPGLLADVLPDKYGNQLINLWLARNGREENSMNPIEQLCFIGARGMGALEFEPTKFAESNKTKNLELDHLVEVATKMLETKANFETNLTKNEQQAMSDILKIGTSAGGARPKAIIAYNKQTGQIRSGQTNAPNGFEHWLLKLDGVSDAQFGTSQNYGRVEMAYYKMAKDCGIHMMESMLLEENGRAHFMTKRFDREGNSTKHHVQTFCAIRHFDFNEIHSYSYEQLFQTMRLLRLSYPEAEQMYRRMVFNVIARNCDDHTKNFAFLRKKNEPWQLAPAYDICHAYRPDSYWVNQHALSINGKCDGILRDDLLILAKEMNIRKPNEIVSEINEVVQNWEHYANEELVPNHLRDQIMQTLLNL